MEKSLLLMLVGFVVGFVLCLAVTWDSGSSIENATQVEAPWAEEVRLLRQDINTLSNGLNRLAVATEMIAKARQRSAISSTMGAIADDSFATGKEEIKSVARSSAPPSSEMEMMKTQGFGWKDALDTGIIEVLVECGATPYTKGVAQYTVQACAELRAIDKWWDKATDEARYQYPPGRLDKDLLKALNKDIGQVSAEAEKKRKSVYDNYRSNICALVGIQVPIRDS